MKTEKQTPTKTRSELLLRLVTTAILIALAAALSNIKILALPLGGSVTLLSMLPICLISIRYGVKWGLCSAFLYSLTQILFDLGSLMSWGLTFTTWIGCLLFDYILPFTLLGISGIFCTGGNRSTLRICEGITLALLLRFLCHFISGVIVFANWCPEDWNLYLYSIVYNGTFLLPELALTLAGAVALFKVPSTRKMLITG